MVDWSRLALASLAGLPGTWDVLPSSDPAPAVCGSYPSADVAIAALEAAGFRPDPTTSLSLPLQPQHDRQTLVRWGGPDGAYVAMARRTES